MGLLYKKFVFADSPVSLSASGLDDLNNNQNSLVADFDLTGGSIIVNLPSINSLLYSGSGTGAGAMTFFVKGTIVANAPTYFINLVPAQGDDICGSTLPSAIQGVGACFHLFIAGINRWGLLNCGIILPPP